MRITKKYRCHVRKCKRCFKVTNIRSQGFHCCDKHHDQNSLGRKGYIQPTLPHHCSSLMEVGAGTGLRTEAEAMKGVLLMAWSSLLAQQAFLDYSGPLAQGQHLPHQSLFKKMSIRLDYRSVLWRYLLKNLEILPPR